MIYEVMLIGDSQVGKSTLVERDQVFVESSYFPTQGVDFVVKHVEIDKQKVRLNIWDTPGDERFQYLLKAYNDRAEALVLCFDVSNRSSFENLETWIERFPRRNRPMFLVGTKADLLRTVSHEEIANLAGMYNLVYMECSSKSGANVCQLPLLIARSLLNRCEKKERRIQHGRNIVETASPCCFQ
jgi:Ras-related protein Rab-1A